MGKRPRRFAWGSTLLLGWILICMGSTAARADWRTFPEDPAYDLSEAPGGRIWAATNAGARGFDGRDWITVPAPGGAARRVLVDRTDTLWVLTNNQGVARFDSLFRSIPGGIPPLPDSQGRSIFEDHRGDMWIGFVNGLAWYQRATGKWSWLTPQNSGLAFANVEQIVEDAAGSLWFTFRRAGGLSILDSSRASTGWSSETVQPGGLPRDSVTCLALGADGSVWCGSSVGGGASQHRPDGSWRHFGRADGLPSDSISTIVSDGRGGLWFGADNSGIGHYNGQSFRFELQTPEGLEIGGIQSMLRDSAGVLWMGTKGKGLRRFDGVDWTSATSPRAPGSTCVASPTTPARTHVVLPGGILRAQLEDRSGKLWFASSDSLVSFLDTTGHWGFLSPGPGRPFPDSAAVILEGRDGTLHFGAYGDGVVSYDRASDSVVRATRDSGLVSDTVTVLYEDRAGDLWAGGPAGLSWRHAGKWRPVTELKGRRVRQVEEDGAGTLWVWVAQELWRISPLRDTVTIFDLRGHRFEDNSYVRPLCRRSDGSLWLGLDAGLFRIEADSLVGVPGPADPNLGTQIETLSEDRTGRLWITTLFGAARLEGTAWTGEFSALTGPLQSSPSAPVYFDDRDIAWIATSTGVNRYDGLGWRFFGRSAGLISSPVDGILEDPGGHFWFRTQCGASEYAPDFAAPQTIFTLEPDSLVAVRDAAFSYSFFGNETSTEYEYRLDDGAWSGFSPATSTTAIGLNDGRHRFEVRARDADGNFDSSPATVDWTVDATPPPALIQDPANLEAVKAISTIVGTTSDPRLRRWRLDVKPAGGGWATDAVTLVDWTAQGRLNEALTAWDTRTVADGYYDLRLTTQDNLGLEAIGQVRVQVDNTAPFADVTSPRDVTRQEGGDVFTIEGDARIYLQPGALDRDATVTITGSSALPPEMAALPPGASAVRRWYEVAWPGVNLVKPATLDVRVTAAAPGVQLSIDRYRADEGWTRLGGTASDSTSLAVAIDREGRYAVVEEGATAVTGGATLTGLSFSPRQFSPSGGGASTLAIGFVLGQAGTADVRVFNRAGRLVSEVARGEFAAGSNLVRWDGRDRAGSAVPEGLYVVTVDALGKQLRNTVIVAP